MEGELSVKYQLGPPLSLGGDRSPLMIFEWAKGEILTFPTYNPMWDPMQLFRWKIALGLSGIRIYIYKWNLMTVWHQPEFSWFILFDKSLYFPLLRPWADSNPYPAPYIYIYIYWECQNDKNRAKNPPCIHRIPLKITISL